MPPSGGAQAGVQNDAQGFLNVWKFIHDRSGLAFAEERLRFLRGRVERRMKESGFVRYQDYLDWLTFSRDDREFLRLMDDLTINETSFFREPRELNMICRTVIPLLLSDLESGQPLRIWSAGCSTGEEPYTVAMLVQEMFATTGAFAYEIVATDLSQEVLTAAQRGRYAQAAVRGIERRYLEQYFVRVDDHFEITKPIRSRVRFMFGNLTDDHMPAQVGPVDLILCRNVMIYFSPEVRRQVVSRLYSTLRPGGYLVVGHNETLHGLSEQFEPSYEDGVLIYRRTPGR